MLVFIYFDIKYRLLLWSPGNDGFHSYFISNLGLTAEGVTPGQEAATGWCSCAVAPDPSCPSLGELRDWWGASSLSPTPANWPPVGFSSLWRPHEKGSKVLPTLAPPRTWDRFATLHLAADLYLRLWGDHTALLVCCLCNWRIIFKLGDKLPATCKSYFSVEETTTAAKTTKGKILWII